MRSNEEVQSLFDMKHLVLSASRWKQHVAVGETDVFLLRKGLLNRTEVKKKV